MWPSCIWNRVVTPELFYKRASILSHSKHTIASSRLCMASTYCKTLHKSCPLLRQCLQQSLGFLKISSIKPFGKPVVDRRQQLTGLSALAQLLPQTTQTHSRSQFQGFGLLTAGDIQCPP